jgi:hypothetical protein
VPGWWTIPANTAGRVQRRIWRRRCEPFARSRLVGA